MTLQTFAHAHRLHTRKDECGDTVIHGKQGLIYTYNATQLAVLVLDLSPRRWGRIRRICEAAGMQVMQDGDAEGSLRFDPTNEKHADLAIKAARVKPKRIPSAAQLEVLRMARRIQTAPR